jgi:hypothetical protein
MALATQPFIEVDEQRQATFRLPAYLIEQLQTIARLEYRSTTAQLTVVLEQFVEDWNARAFLSR